ncbi:PL29 family lyase N-terminal domain-containing protein [Alistipes sp.]|uniref:PL29 family lyase N-terminal domain-containing protein n=1 Tax=Alistipes sp. TaxID=1872444 RepID=UPI003AB7047B
MKKLLSLLICALLLFGCSKSYDDSALRNDLDDLANRVAKLEELCKQINTNISSLQTIVTALQNSDYITSVTPITKDGKTVGYTITFAKSNSITIYNGTDGKDGVDGSDGEDGKDGVAPTIGVKQDTDGVYYWTLNGDWLTDDKGNKIKAKGTDGKDGVDGSGGGDGTNGKDGVTPKLEIREGYWWISYDNGTNWTQLGKATGEDGTDGKDGSSIFKSVTEDDKNVYFTLADDTIITVPKSVILSIRFDSSDLINISAGETKTLNYTITSSSETVSIETFEQAGWKVEITEQTKLAGTIAITAPNPIRDGKILIILTDAQNNSYMKSISLKGIGNTITTVQDTYTVNAAGGLLDVAVTANIDYTIQIPQDAKTWLSVQSQGENIRFSVTENESYDGRSADITLAGVDGTTSCRVTIMQLQKDAIILSESDYELTYEQQTLQVVLQSNTDLLVTIPETDTWITHVSTRAMTERTLNFNIASNDGSQSRTGYITIQNTDKNVSQTITIVQKGDVADVLTFEDPLFKAYLTANFDTNSDKEIDTKEALNVTAIKCDGKSIYSLKGIEYFANLETLDCSNNSVVELDLTQNTQLTEVKCFSNSLVELKLDGLENLSYLDCNTKSDNNRYKHKSCFNLL